MPTPQVLLENVKTGPPIACKNLELIPLLRDEPSSSVIDYILATEALDRGVLRVAEVDASGSVPELSAISAADVAILLLDGEELIGAKQNRILNTDVLLRPHAKKTIPVSCVEQGRWRHTRPDFAAGSYAPPPLRASKSRSVSRSLRESNRADSDQCEVWQEVEEFLVGMATPSGTSAMSDAFEQRKNDLDALVAGLPCPEGAVGVVVLINGRFAALDLFDRSSTVQQFWPRLVAGYAADAAGKAGGAVSLTTATDVTAILERVREVECVVCDGVDLGKDWRFEAADLVGSALVVEDTANHLSAFPNDADRVETDVRQGRIAGPSQRRRGGGHRPVC